MQSPILNASSYYREESYKGGPRVYVVLLSQMYHAIIGRNPMEVTLRCKREVLNLGFMDIIRADSMLLANEVVA